MEDNLKLLFIRSCGRNDRTERLQCGFVAVGGFDIVRDMVATPYAGGIPTDLVSCAVRHQKLLE